MEQGNNINPKEEALTLIDHKQDANKPQSNSTSPTLIKFDNS